MNQVQERIEDSVIDDSFYNVIMFNDDRTPFEYVIVVLNEIFNYQINEGLRIAMYIHTHGQAVVATLSMDEAYAKMEEVDQMNAKSGYMLQTNVEKA